MWGKPGDNKHHQAFKIENVPGSLFVTKCASPSKKIELSLFCFKCACRLAIFKMCLGDYLLKTDQLKKERGYEIKEVGKTIFRLQMIFPPPRGVYFSRHPNIFPQRTQYSSPLATRILALKRPKIIKKGQYYVYLDLI